MRAFACGRYVASFGRTGVHTVLIHSLESHLLKRALINTRLKAGCSEEVVGVIVVDHGSRKAASNDRLKHLVSSYKEASQLSLVEPAHMELSEPSIATAYRRCAEQGATRVVCFPFFLSPGRHVQEDIPLSSRRSSCSESGYPRTQLPILSACTKTL